MEKKKKYSILEGALQALPIMLAYFPVALALGVIARQSGFSAVETFLFSALLLSGSGQSIALNLLALAEPITAIWSTTIIINLRYFLMATALAPSLGGWSAFSRYAFSAFITDETFALHVKQFADEIPPRRYVFAVNLASYGAWVSGTVIGFWAGTLISDTRPFGFDFAIPAMFIALLVLQLNSRRLVCLAVLSGVFSLALEFSPLQHWAILIAGSLTALIGTLWEQWTKN